MWHNININYIGVADIQYKLLMFWYVYRKSSYLLHTQRRYIQSTIHIPPYELQYFISIQNMYLFGFFWNGKVKAEVSRSNT